MISRKSEKYNEITDLISTLDELLAKETNHKLDAHTEELIKKYSTEKVELDDEISQLIYENDLSELEEKSRKYKNWENTLWRAFYLSVYTEFENEFTNLCKATRNMMSLDLSINELSDKGIVRAKKYLEKVAGFDLGIEQKDWTAFLYNIKIRNLLAHSGGSLKDASKEILDFIDSSGGIINEGNKIIMRKEFVEQLIELYRKIYLKTCTILDDYAVKNLPKQKYDKYFQ